ncbi:MAG: hypothetical protein WAP35_10360, partial [Solirubrobacterales bacterium]
ADARARWIGHDQRVAPSPPSRCASTISHRSGPDGLNMRRLSPSGLTGTISHHSNQMDGEMLRAIHFASLPRSVEI